MRLLRPLLVITCAVFLAATALHAQSWQIKGHGVGLYDGSRPDYDRVLRTVQQGGSWNAQELLAQGSFNQNGPRAFGAWIQGPPTSAFKNQYGTPVYMIKYRLTDPRGQARSFGPYGFYEPGFITAFLNLSSGPWGTWRIEWLLVQRDTLQETSVATDSFEMAEHPGGSAATKPAPGHSEKATVGLLDLSQDYDQTLRVVRAGSRWSLKELTDLGAFSSGSGPKTFCVWYQGPHTSTFTNRFGTPELMYKVKITAPNGNAESYGPYGFAKPGFGYRFMNVSALGTYRVEWFTVHRETHAETPVLNTSFELVP